MNKLYLRVKDLAAKKKVSLAKVERDYFNLEKWKS